jgi:uncharacterized LabA/DUF88 family protein
MNGHVRKMMPTPHRKDFLDYLAKLEGVDLRLGRLFANGWKIRDLRELQNRLNAENKVWITSNDFLPNFVQKGVDAEIMWDVINLGQNKVVQSIVLLTSDSDFVPTIHRAKNLGLRVYLMPFGQRIAQDLFSAVDGLLDPQLDFPDQAKAFLPKKENEAGGFPNARVISRGGGG